jgi:hypothetical protein
VQSIVHLALWRILRGRGGPPAGQKCSHPVLWICHHVVNYTKASAPQGVCPASTREGQACFTGQITLAKSRR